MTSLAAFVFVFSVIIGSGSLSVWLYQRQRKARRLHPPEPAKFLRGPGESLFRRSDELLEKFLSTILTGACLTVALVGVPALVLRFFPEANPLILFGSGFLLFVAGSIWVVRSAIKILNERANLRLGWIGERLVAESLEMCLAKGCRVFHDVPIEGHCWKANIDHVVVSANGIVVVETKMRSKPSDRKNWENRVEYDGSKIVWPRHPNDAKTIGQVKRNAEWIEKFLRDHCGTVPSVKTVVAIPGWNVVERVRDQPRVVRGERAGDAVLYCLDTSSEPRFTAKQVAAWVTALDERCRDVEG